MASDRSITPATKADLAGIDALLGRSYPALLKGAYDPSVLVTAIPLISRANPSLVASGTYFVVKEAGRILGAGGWTFAVPGGGGGASGVGHIRHVVTDHTHVREGIGRALMEHVLSDARAAGTRRMECYSTLMAVPFYASVGFEEVAPMSIALRPGIDFPAVHMRRDL